MPFVWSNKSSIERLALRSFRSANHPGSSIAFPPPVLMSGQKGAADSSVSMFRLGQVIHSFIAPTAGGGSSLFPALVPFPRLV